MDISQVAKASGIPASTLRYYEEKGLIKSIGRNGLRRTFGPRILEQLSLIALGQEAGFSLEEISQMFAPDGNPQIERQVLHDKADELERTIRKLTNLRDGLRHAATCPAPSHLECPKFRRLMQAASSAAKNNKSRKTQSSNQLKRPNSA